MKNSPNQDSEKDELICSNCIMDINADPTLVIEKNGWCERCNVFHKQFLSKWNYGKGHENELKILLDTIKESGKDKEYDCLLGFSGGFDSSYMLHLAVVEWGLRPLVFHIDAGFNLPVGEQNIKKMVDKLGVDLKIEKVDFDDVRNFQIALFRTGLAACLDYAQDHAFIAILDEYAEKNKIEYILNGENLSTEAFVNPKYWDRNGSTGSDSRFLKDVIRKHSESPLRNYPFTNVLRRKVILPYVKGVKIVKPLNYVEYIQDDVKVFLNEEYGWEAYPQKHFESLMTKFLEGYWFPKRFGYDVRRHQLSSLVVTGQMTREQALDIVSKPSLTEFESKELFRQVAERLQISEDELQSYLEMPLWGNHYKNSDNLYKLGNKIFTLLKLDTRIRK